MFKAAAQTFVRSPVEWGVLFVVQQFILWVCRHGSRHQAGQDFGVASRCGVVQRGTTLGVPTQCRSFVLQQDCHTIIMTQHRLRRTEEKKRG